MKIHTAEGKAPMRWRYLFAPEDTSAGGRPCFDGGRDHRCIRCLKLGLWVVISIVAALAIGNI